MRLAPLLVLGQGKERNLLLVLAFSLASLDDGSDELLEEALDLKQTGPEVVEEVENQTLDVRTIVIL